MEKIDILMATYNGERYLKEQLDSVLSQTYKNFNLIISDDASNDNTKIILEEYSKKDERIRLIFNDENIGSNRNFSKLLKEVKSNYFMFCDQDDVWYNTKVEDSVRKLDEDNADMVFTDLEIVDSKLNLISDSFNKKKKYYNKIKKFKDIKMTYLYNVVTGCTILCKSKYINEALECSYNEKILHDHILALVVAAKGKISYLDKTTLKYRQHTSNQVGSKRYVDKFNTFDEVRKHLIDVKLNLFKYYIENDKLFNKQTKKLNNKAFDYFTMLEKKNNINFKNIGIFNKLYINEGVISFLINFFIMNVPCLVRVLFNINKILKKGVKNK